MHYILAQASTAGMHMQAIRCLVIDDFSLLSSRRPGKNCQCCWLYGSSSSLSFPDLVQTSNVEDLQGRKWTLHATKLCR